MHALERQWISRIDTPLLERKPELEKMLRLLTVSPQRTLVIEGAPGTGKTTLATQFARTFADHFPGGIEFRRGRSRPDEVAGTNTNRDQQSLLVFDGLDEAWPPERDWPERFITNSLEANPNLYVLATSRLGVAPSLLDRFGLASLTYSEVTEILKNSSGDDSTPPPVLVELAFGNALLASLLGNLGKERGDWATVVQSLASFRRPGLLDASGNPVSSRSSTGKHFITDARIVNDFILEIVRRNPEIVYELPARRFEEMSAELFSRLGYEVELTPASKDGGKDLIVVKRSDLGTMLTLVECKRYAPDRPVGVEVVRALNGVVEEGRATSGIVLTTSRFTAGAKRLEHVLQYRMTLKDYGDFKLLLDRALTKGHGD